MMTESQISRRRALQSGTAALGVPLLSGLLGGCSTAEAKRLSFLNWIDYVDPSLLKDFTRESGVSVAYETYASNDELAKRLAVSGAQRRGRSSTTFDLIVPSDNLVRQLRDGGSLRKLPSDLKGIDNLSPEFRKLSFDPGNQYTVPWATGTTGIGYSKKAFPDGPPDWSAFLDSAVSGKATLLDETRDAMAAALFLLGEDPNTEDSGTISTAGKKLAEIVNNGVDIDAKTYLDRIRSGKTVIAQAYSSDMAQAKDDNDDLEFVVPAGGGLRWVDSLCIPVRAPHPNAARAFIEFYLQPKVSAANAAFVRINTGNKAALEFVPDEVVNDPSVFPTESELAKLSFTESLPDKVKKLYDSAFASAKKG